ncbi:hypothetical protein H0H87_007054 [Tephrocybe sp. NHM501043]|nr:hypothetical protein H0H87_007054 [Tephrocybe sp. NHM501043]
MLIASLWVSPIQMIIGIGLLIGNLGYSALVGLAVMIFGIPFQAILVLIMFKQRDKGVKITDNRVQLTTEVLQGIRLIKMYAWEEFYASEIEKLRAGEIAALRKISWASSILIASISFVPSIATVLTFITYSATGHELNVATVFTSLQLFTIIRIPFLVFPMVLASLADILVALRRISKYLSAEELGEYCEVDETRTTAVDLDGDFTWEPPLKTLNKAAEDAAKKVKARKDKPNKGKCKGDTLSTVAEQSPAEAREKAVEEEVEKPFELRNLKLAVPKGSFVAIVGRVGSGKSSILQALIGEMRKTRGQVVIGGSMAYVPQTSWIRNANLRENVFFGCEANEERFQEVIKACHLEHDIAMLPQGGFTEIGEKGINLSGGQKARVSLARAAYSESDIVLLDDPLSAVDSILVTHALHVLDKTDYIYVMDHGVITERGTYQELIQNSSILSTLMEEHGSLASQQQGKNLGDQGKGQATVDKAVKKDNELDAALMQAEERNTGAVSWDVYKKYMVFAGGIFWAPIIILLLVLNEASQVGNNIFLGFWTSQSIKGFSQEQYMGVYAGFGIAQSLFSFLLSLAFCLMALFGSLRLFKSALNGVLRSPISFFDTTPLGRIQSRLSKDQYTLDSELAIILWQNTSIADAERGLDKENRAYYMTISIQRWLSVRLDLFGNTLVLGIALFAAGYRHSVNPAKIGVVLSYTLAITQTFSEMINMFAKNEQNMNAVERVLHYTELPPEGGSKDGAFHPGNQEHPPASWPSNGQITFTDVNLSYRPGLPPVLKNVSFAVQAGEKIGIVGRTGAGKTSLLQALFRIVELHKGQIDIDGFDISRIGLSVLRNSLALVPQDSTLFLGTLRANLDPMGLRTDAELISVLQRAWLLPSGNSTDPAAEAKFSLDSTVGDEGSNFSAGEKQLLALCRALVKNSRIIVLDEATSSVDVETDAKLQQTIKKEFASSTLLCIAHRLNTIAYYDRVLVMDGGEVAEFDTVLNLYDNESSIFRSLCNEANLQRADIIRIRTEHDAATKAS